MAFKRPWNFNSASRLLSTNDLTHVEDPTTDLYAALDRGVSALIDDEETATGTAVRTHGSGGGGVADEVAWEDVTGKPETFPAEAPTWDEVTDKPTTFTPADASVTDAKISGTISQSKITDLISTLAGLTPTDISGLQELIDGLGDDFGELSDEVATYSSAISVKAHGNRRVWNGTTWSSRPDGIPTGEPAESFSTQDPACTSGPMTGNVEGDLWFPHPDAVVG